MSGKIHPTAVIGEPPEHGAYIERPEVCMPPLIDETARVGKLAIVDGGFKEGTVVGPGAWIMDAAHVGHDTRVLANARVGSGAILCGHVWIGEDAVLGVGVKVLPGVRVGDRAYVGAGAVVASDVPADEVWAGVPAKKLRDA